MAIISMIFMCIAKFKHPGTYNSMRLWFGKKKSQAFSGIRTGQLWHKTSVWKYKISLLKNVWKYKSIKDIFYWWNWLIKQFDLNLITENSDVII